MNENPDQDGKIAAPVFVEDLFLTDVFLIKARFDLVSTGFERDVLGTPPVYRQDKGSLPDRKRCTPG